MWEDTCSDSLNCNCICIASNVVGGYTILERLKEMSGLNLISPADFQVINDVVHNIVATVKPL